MRYVKWRLLPDWKYSWPQLNHFLRFRFKSIIQNWNRYLFDWVKWKDFQERELVHCNAISLSNPSPNQEFAVVCLVWFVPHHHLSHLCLDLIEAASWSVSESDITGQEGVDDDDGNLDFANVAPDGGTPTQSSHRIAILSLIPFYFNLVR